MDGNTVNVSLAPGPISLTDLGRWAALPHLVARHAGDAGLAPVARALRPHLGVLGRGGGPTAEGLTGEVWTIPVVITVTVSLSQYYLSSVLTRLLSCCGTDICCVKILREIPGIRDCT